MSSETTQPKVSVIVPIYNVSRYLDEALDSAERQTCKDIEIICINDGSTDNSLSIMQDHAEHDARIKIIDKENAGYGAACNQGILAARGTWICILEPDDWLNLDMFEAMTSFVEQFKETIDVVKAAWTNVFEWDDPDTEHALPSEIYHRFKTSTKPFTLAENSRLIEYHPSIWSALYRREFLLENSISFPEYPGAGWADNPFLISTLVQAQHIVYLDRCFYNYRADLPGSTKNHKTVDALTRPFDRWMDMLELLQELKVTDRNIIASHYVRGFNYIRGAIADDGWINALVQKETRRVFSAMDPEIVKDLTRVSPIYKQLFFDIREIPYKVPSAYWRTYMVDEAKYVYKTLGFSYTLGRVRGAIRNRLVKPDSGFPAADNEPSVFHVPTFLPVEDAHGSKDAQDSKNTQGSKGEQDSDNTPDEQQALKPKKKRRIKKRFQAQHNTPQRSYHQKRF